MSDNNPTVVATPYPTYMTGGNDDGDDAFKAALVSHSSASVERSQSNGFDSLRSQLLHRDVSGARRDAVQTRFDLGSQIKDSEIRAAERFSEVKDLIHAQAARDLAEARADLRAAKQEALLQAILAKVS